MQFQMISSGLCRECFPAKFDGGWSTLLYVMHRANKARRGSVVNLRKITITNTRHDAVHYGGVENDNAQDLWNRSTEDMPIEARLLGRFVNFRRATKILNLIYRWKRI
jgi:hypothetical protein